MACRGETDDCGELGGNAKTGIIDADFYLADLLSEHNITLKEKLFVLLRENRYELDRRIDPSGLLDSKTATFNDKQQAHTQFWNRYNRPPKREYWDYIVNRRDLLVPQDVRERKGSFFTPQIWVEKSQEYIADALGENWQDEYTIWDCAAGTGNLLAGLTNKYNIWASTLDQADVDVMKDRIRNGANLLESHVFRFDFLNDSFDTLPDGLRAIVNDPEKRKKLLIYINPPYAEAATTTTKTGRGKNKEAVARNNLIYTKYGKEFGGALNELFAQFFIRIYREIPGSALAEFSKLKILQAPNFVKFRAAFLAKLQLLFLIPAATFDNVKGKFPIGFFIWNTASHEVFTKITADVFNKDAVLVGKKELIAPPTGRLLMDWLRAQHDKTSPRLAFLRMLGSDIQNNDGVFFTSTPSPSDLRERKTCNITSRNVIPLCVYLTVRHVIECTWLNDRDQYLWPQDRWEDDFEFQADCLIYALFCNSNNISGRVGINHWIPFTEEGVDAKDKFASHFMTDFMAGKPPAATTETPDLFSCNVPTESMALIFSPEASVVFDAGRELWRYYHAQEGANVNASLYDIREYFQGRKENGKMKSTSNDSHYMELIAVLRTALKTLGEKIEPKVYEYGFLLK